MGCIFIWKQYSTGITVSTEVVTSCEMCDVVLCRKKKKKKKENASGILDYSKKKKKLQVKC